jgi:predicted nuclease with TOPRIM domain
MCVEDFKSLGQCLLTSVGSLQKQAKEAEQRATDAEQKANLNAGKMNEVQVKVSEVQEQIETVEHKYEKARAQKRKLEDELQVIYNAWIMRIIKPWLGFIPTHVVACAKHPPCALLCS